MRRYIFGLLAAAGYVVLLVRWFHDPGEPTADGFLVRSRPAWPFLLVFLVALGLWLHSLGGRLRAMLAELRGAWGLERRDVALLAAILAVALAYQLPIMLHPYGALDGDAVLSGIMAKHIAEGRPAPAFVYEMRYGGTFSAHVLALLYSVAGTSVAGLLVVTRLFFFLFLIAEFVMLRAAAGRFVAGAVTIALALPPPGLLSHLSYVEFPEMLALGAIAVALITARLAGRLRDDLWYAVAGVVIGIGFWTQPLIVPTVAAACVAVLLFRGVSHALRAGWRVVAGFVIGVMPALVGWGLDVSVFASWLATGDDRGERIVTTGESIRRLAHRGLLLVFGPDERGPSMPITGTVLAVAIVGSALWGLVAAWRTWRGSTDAAADRAKIRAATLMALALGVLLHLGVFVLSPFNYLVSPPRYLVSLYVGVPAVMAMMIVSLARSQRPARGMLAVVFGAWAIAGIPGSTGWIRTAIVEHDARAHSLPEIEAAGIRYCEAPFWDAYPVTFFTLERVICASNGVVRDPYYRNVISKNRTPGIGRPHLLARPGDEWLENNFEQARRNDIPHHRLVTEAYHVLVREPRERVRRRRR